MTSLQPDLPEDLKSGREEVSAWYDRVRSPEPQTPRTPRTRGFPPDGDSSSPEQASSSPYKDQTVDVPPLRMGLRSGMTQVVRDLRS